MCSMIAAKTERLGEAGVENRADRAFGLRLSIASIKPFTYFAMHLAVVVAVAFVLTQDWRIALGIGIVEPLVQTVA